MPTYKPLGSERYEFCHPIDKTDFQVFADLIDGQARQASWKPIAVELIRKDQGRTLRPSDSPWLGTHALIFKESAIAAIGPMLREYGELLPLECADAEVYVFNPTRIIDALDVDASSVLRFDNGELMGVTRHVFRPDAVEGIDIFKIPNLRPSSTFLSERFVDLWNSSGLRGLTFTRAWPLEPGAENAPWLF